MTNKKNYYPQTELLNITKLVWLYAIISLKFLFPSILSTSPRVFYVDTPCVLLPRRSSQTSGTEKRVEMNKRLASVTAARVIGFRHFFLSSMLFAVTHSSFVVLPLTADKSSREFDELPLLRFLTKLTKNKQTLTKNNHFSECYERKLTETTDCVTRSYKLVQKSTSHDFEGVFSLDEVCALKIVKELIPTLFFFVYLFVCLFLDVISKGR